MKVVLIAFHLMLQHLQPVMSPQSVKISKGNLPITQMTSLMPSKKLKQNLPNRASTCQMMKLP